MGLLGSGAGGCGERTRSNLYVGQRALGRVHEAPLVLTEEVGGAGGIIAIGRQALVPGFALRRTIIRGIAVVPGPMGHDKAVLHVYGLLLGGEQLRVNARAVRATALAPSDDSEHEREEGQAAHSTCGKPGGIQLKGRHIATHQMALRKESGVAISEVQCGCRGSGAPNKNSACGWRPK